VSVIEAVFLLGKIDYASRRALQDFGDSLAVLHRPEAAAHLLLSLLVNVNQPGAARPLGVAACVGQSRQQSLAGPTRFFVTIANGRTMG